MKHNYYYLAIILLLAIGCKKSTTNDTNSANSPFTFDTRNAYINQEVDIFTSRAGTFTWDFGDGVPATSQFHTYTQAGVYTITAKSGTASYSKKIRIYPGTCSVLFKNGANIKFTQVSVAILNTDNKYVVDPIRFVLQPGAASDTLFLTVPKTIYTPNITLGLSFTTNLLTDVSFSTVNFAALAGSHSSYNITGDAMGFYSFIYNHQTPVSGFSSLKYALTL